MSQPAASSGSCKRRCCRVSSAAAWADCQGGPSGGGPALGRRRCHATGELVLADRGGISALAPCAGAGALMRPHQHLRIGFLCGRWCIM